MAAGRAARLRDLSMVIQRMGDGERGERMKEREKDDSGSFLFSLSSAPRLGTPTKTNKTSLLLLRDVTIWDLYGYKGIESLYLLRDVPLQINKNAKIHDTNVVPSAAGKT